MTTLQELLEEYLLTLRSKETRRSYTGILKRCITFLGGPDREVVSVTTKDILAWRQSMADQNTRYNGHPRHPEVEGGLSEMTIYRNLVTAKGFFQYAVDMDYLSRSPMKGLRLERPPRTSASEKAAPLATLHALLPLHTASRATGRCTCSCSTPDVAPVQCARFASTGSILSTDTPG